MLFSAMCTEYWLYPQPWVPPAGWQAIFCNVDWFIARAGLELLVILLTQAGMPEWLARFMPHWFSILAHLLLSFLILEGNPHHCHTLQCSCELETITNVNWCEGDTQAPPRGSQPLPNLHCSPAEKHRHFYPKTIFLPLSCFRGDSVLRAQRQTWSLHLCYLQTWRPLFSRVSHRLPVSHHRLPGLCSKGETAAVTGSPGSLPLGLPSH